MLSQNLVRNLFLPNRLLYTILRLLDDLPHRRLFPLPIVDLLLDGLHLHFVVLSLGLHLFYLFGGGFGAAASLFILLL